MERKEARVICKVVERDLNGSKTREWVVWWDRVLFKKMKKEMFQKIKWILKWKEDGIQKVVIYNMKWVFKRMKIGSK